MNFAVPAKIGFTYLVEILDAEGNVKKTSGVSPNIITQYGLDVLGGIVGERRHDNLVVGSGSTPPTLADTALESRIGSPAPFGNPTNTLAYTTTKPYYIQGRLSAEWAMGAIVGNISELGICASSYPDQLISRALIRDTSGNPTTLTVLSDEILRVSVIVREYMPEDFTGSFDLVDGSGTVIETINYEAGGFCKGTPSQYRGSCYYISNPHCRWYKRL